jgi:hypothetical protein
MGYVKWISSWYPGSQVSLEVGEPGQANSVALSHGVKFLYHLGIDQSFLATALFHGRLEGFIKPYLGPVRKLPQEG